jgi:hypothetical protein
MLTAATGQLHVDCDHWQLQLSSELLPLLPLFDYYRYPTQDWQ